MHVDLFVDGAEDSLPETAPSKSLAPQMGLSDADGDGRRNRATAMAAMEDGR